MPDRSATMETALPRHRFTVADYHRMVEAGILTENDRVELIRGEIVVMAPIGSPHSACVCRLNEAFEPLGATTLRSSQNPVVLMDSEPEPDFLLLARRDDYYAGAHPTPADVYLLVEVADSSQRFDRGVKGPLYASNGIREYWIVDLETDRVEVHRSPEERRWREVSIPGRGDSVALEAFPEFVVPLDDVLP